MRPASPITLCHPLNLISKASLMPNNLLPISSAACVLLLCCVSQCCLAQEPQLPVPTKEVVPVTVPPAAKQYIAFYSGPALDFTIDPDSISVLPGDDAEIRYAMKATSKQGAVNVSYEGIRCSNRQKIIYAVGAPNGSWSLSRNPEWNAIYVNGINVPHATLANDYFCSVISVAGNVADIRRRIIFKTPIEH